MMKNLIAQGSGIKLGPLHGFGSLGLETGDSASAGTIFTNFISSAIGLMTIIAIIWFIFIFFIGAIGIINSGGDKGKVESSRKNILNGIIGLVIVIAAIFLIKLIGFLLGIENILNFNELFGKVTGASQ
jgi:hypothetical protein